jgi:hypothetical protein
MTQFSKQGAAILALSVIVPVIAFAQLGTNLNASTTLNTQTNLTGNSTSTTMHLLHLRQTLRVGTVTSVSANTISLHANNGTDYVVATTNAKLVRRYGAAMLIGDIQAGDMLQIRGTVNGNNFDAILIRNLSLQAKNGAFVGTVGTTGASSFILQSKNRGSQTINFNSDTVFKKEGKPATAADVTSGATVHVSGVWDRTNSNVTAKSVYILLKAIHFSGTLSAKTDTTLTIASKEGTTYLVDISKARLVRQHNGKSVIGEFNVGDKMQVWGKHVEGSTNIAASLAKDDSITSK